MSGRRVVAAALAVALTVATAGPVFGLFSTVMEVPAISVTTGSWDLVLWLHNRPSPPVGNTRAQVGLTMDTNAPTTTTLYQYATDVSRDPGRVVRRSSDSGATSPDRVANWLTAPFTAARPIAGTATVSLAAQPLGKRTDGAVLVVLRDVDAAGVARTIGSVLYRSAAWPTNKTFTTLTLGVPIAPTELAAGHRLELRITVPNSSEDDLLIAYDTTTFPSSITLP